MRRDGSAPAQSGPYCPVLPSVRSAARLKGQEAAAAPAEDARAAADGMRVTVKPAFSPAVLR